MIPNYYGDDEGKIVDVTLHDNQMVDGTNTYITVDYPKTSTIVDETKPFFLLTLVGLIGIRNFLL